MISKLVGRPRSCRLRRRSLARSPCTRTPRDIHCPKNCNSSRFLPGRRESPSSGAAKTLRESDRRKDEFLATLAHELRNPLAPVINSLELMKMADGNQELLENARSTMERQIAQMVRLIDDLLDVSRITSNKLELKKGNVELASIIHHALEASRPHSERAGHRIH